MIEELYAALLEVATLREKLGTLHQQGRDTVATTTAQHEATVARLKGEIENLRAKEAGFISQRGAVGSIVANLTAMVAQAEADLNGFNARLTMAEHRLANPGFRG
jgi:uncharacterized protein involved in exopolysaccharide biosynthesis